MATNKIRITFSQVHCLRESSVFGEASWSFEATANGVSVGNPNEVFPLKPTQKATLPSPLWSAEVDVSGKKAGDFVNVTFKAIEKGIISNSNMGEVSLKLNHPFENELDYSFFGSPAGSPPVSNYAVQVKVAISSATPAPGGGSAVPAAKSGTGTTVTTIAGSQLLPRVEVSPVVPTLALDQLPPRPDMLGLVGTGANTAHAVPLPLTGDLALNALANPSFIPILSPAEADFKKKAARLAVTYLRPANLDISKLVWKVKSGPVTLQAPTTGTLEVLAFATGTATTPAEIEVRWQDARGPVLATFRAWTGQVKHVPTRATLIVGTTPGATPRATEADIATHIRLANVLLYQAGLLMVPDHDKRTFDGAVESAAHPGVYTIKTADNSMTLGVNKDLPPHPVRLNFRPGAMHLCYIKSLNTATAAGSATDRPGLKGERVTLGGTPSSSWVPPTGVDPDKAAADVKMLTIDASAARATQKDKDYLAARQAADPTFPNDAFDRLFGCIMPDYTVPNDEDWPQTVAHEVGHVLGLRHRGNPQTDPAKNKLGSNDEVNGKGGKGHPFLENVMSYGYTRSQDLDLIQTQKVRAHACAVAPTPVTPPPPPPPPPPPAEKEARIKELQGIFGVPQTGVWDAATEAAAQNNMVRFGTNGPVVGWVQKHLTALGVACGPVDNISGSQTTGGIRKWQETHPPLDNDSIAGPRTMQSIAEA